MVCKRCDMTSVTTSPGSLRMLCVAFLSSLQLPVHRGDRKATTRTVQRTPPQYSKLNARVSRFNSASHSLDDIMICGVKQCSGSNISRKQHEMSFIFKLGTLPPNGLNIDFNFLWLWFQRVLKLREIKQWFSYLFYVRVFRAGAHTTFCIAWLNPPTEEGSSPKRLGYLTKIWHFSQLFSLPYLSSLLLALPWQ